MISASTPVVDWAALGTVVYVSLLASLGIVSSFTVTVIGATRSAESWRAGRTIRAAGYATLGALAASVTAGAVIVGLIYMTQK